MLLLSDTATSVWPLRSDAYANVYAFHCVSLISAPSLQMSEELVWELFVQAGPVGNIQAVILVPLWNT